MNKKLYRAKETFTLGKNGFEVLNGKIVELEFIRIDAERGVCFKITRERYSYDDQYFACYCYKKEVDILEKNLEEIFLD